MGSSSGPANRQREKQACLDDDYMMYTYKVIPCSRVSTHNWKLCHFSHVGEVAARRRSPACHQADLCAYVSANKECPDGDKCPYAHNAFESWLHPDRYKTTLCSYAGSCTRKFCFFAHSASELRTPTSKQHCGTAGLQLAKTTSLDTTTSVGTPNSSSSNFSSSSVAQSMQSNWTATTGSPMVAAGHHAAAVAAGAACVNQLPQLQQGSLLAQQGLAGMCLVPAGLQQQHHLMTTVFDSHGNSNLVSTGPPGLSTIMVTAPQLAATDEAGMHVGSLASDTGAAGSGNIWDNPAGMALVANVCRAGSTPISVTDCSGSFAGSFMFDPSSPQTPLQVASMSPTQSPVVPLAAMPGATGNSGALQLISLQQALEASQQQQHNGQLRQQLLQHLLTVQQKQYQQKQQQDAQVSMTNWSLPAVDNSLLNSKMTAMLNGNSVTVQQPSLATNAAGNWPVMQMQDPQQLQSGLAKAADVGVQVLSAPQLPGMAANMVNVAAASLPVGVTAVAADGQSRVLAGLQATDAAQLSQPLSMLTFAMPQPA